MHEILAEPMKPSVEVSSIPKPPRKLSANASAVSSSVDAGSGTGSENMMSPQEEEDFELSGPGNNGTAFSVGDEEDLDIALTDSGADEASNESEDQPNDGVGVRLPGVSFIDGEWVDNNSKSV